MIVRADVADECGGWRVCADSDCEDDREESTEGREDVPGAVIKIIFSSDSLFIKKTFCIFAAEMRTRNEYIDLIKAHESELQTRFGITTMRLFGSVARGENRDDSDIDLFVTMPPKMYNYIEAVQYLEGILGCSVDLICNHRNLRPFFRQQIERDGINVFTAGSGS